MFGVTVPSGILSSFVIDNDLPSFGVAANTGAAIENTVAALKASDMIFLEKFIFLPP